MACFATPYGLRYAAHCFSRAHAQQNGSALIPAGGKLGVTSKASKESDEGSAKFLTDMVKYIRFVREARNACEHPQDKKRVEIQNFRMLPSGQISAPTFQLIHPKFPEPQTDLSQFLVATVDSLINLYGLWIARLCARHAGFGKLAVGVVSKPEEDRQYPKVRFGYALPTQDGWKLIG